MLLVGVGLVLIILSLSERGMRYVTVASTMNGLSGMNRKKAKQKHHQIQIRLVSVQFSGSVKGRVVQLS